MIEITTKEEITDETRPLIVCFTNPLTCAPCKALKPHYNNVSKVFSDDVVFAELNVLEHMDVALDFGVSGTPTILAFVDGDVHTVESRTTIPLIEEINALVNA